VPSRRDRSRDVLAGVGRLTPRVLASGGVGRLTPRVLASAGVAVALAACGSSGSPGSSGAQTTATGPTQSGFAVIRPKTPTKTPRKTVHPAAAKPSGAPIGASRSVNAHGTKLVVTTSKVTDPLRGSGATLLPATRVVAVYVRIANRGPGGYDSSSTGDISIIPSSGVASPAFAPRGPCKTPDQDFDNAIGPGESRTGCVVFTLNVGARLAGERFAADGGGAGSVM
jgi:hypothetical protein